MKKGQATPPEIRKKIAEALRGKKHTAERCENQRRARLGKYCGIKNWRWKGGAETWAARQKATNLKKNYGMAIDDFWALIAKQGGVCAICGLADWGTKRPCVDHDHVTGRIRGILCVRCNTAIGLLRDNPSISKAATHYLEHIA